MFYHANCGWYGYSGGTNSKTWFSSPLTVIEILKDEKGLSDLIHEYYKNEYELVVRNQELKTIELEGHIGGPLIGSWREDFLQQVKAASKPKDHVVTDTPVQPDINPVIMD